VLVLAPLLAQLPPLLLGLPLLFGLLLAPLPALPPRLLLPQPRDLLHHLHGQLYQQAPP
jgi:hypothetical protein